MGSNLGIIQSISSCKCCKDENSVNINNKEAKIDDEFKYDKITTMKNALSLREGKNKSSLQKTILIQSCYRRYDYKKKFRILLQRRIQLFDTSIIQYGRFITDEQMNQRIVNIKRIEIEKQLNPFKVLDNERRRFCLVFTKTAFCFNDNTIYKGSWNYFGKKHGYGIFVHNTGSVYEGIWENDTMSGRGRFIDLKGNYYKGYWFKGNANGKGKLVLADGSIYEGEWKDDGQNGYGREVSADGSRYEGYYLNGRKEGKGKFTWSDGSIYEGTFDNSTIHGNGVFKWKDGRKYTGQWVNNKMDGKGVFEWPNNKKYEGEYKQNKKEGKGTYYWNKDTSYTGYWLNNTQHGEGEFHHKGSVTKGIFRFGKYVHNNESKEAQDRIKSNNNNKKVSFNPGSPMNENNNATGDISNIIPNIKESLKFNN